MQVGKLLTAAGVAVPLSLMVQPVAHAASNILFLLDGSNSMWGKVEGRAKIDVAKETLDSLIGELPSDTRVGLVAYGHSKKEDCSDIQVLAPLGELDPKAFKSAIASIVPKGKTPLAAALETSIDQFADLEESNSVVLISDGVDTCGGDPCAAVADLRKKGLHVRVHVVGFDVNSNERQQLQCIAEKGDGQYFNTASIQGFKEAVSKVEKAVVEAKQEVATAQTVQSSKTDAGVYFQDEFEGDKLLEPWEILNPDPDSYAVENGKFLLVSRKPGLLSQDTVENLIRLNLPLPKGDWTLTTSVRIDFQTQAERFVVGIYESKESFLVGVLNAGMACDCSINNPCAPQVYLEITRQGGGEQTRFRQLYWQGEVFATPGNEGGGTCGAYDPGDGEPFNVLMSPLDQPVVLRLRKQGRSYTFAAKSAASERGEWVESQKLTILHGGGSPILAFLQRADVEGESSAEVEWFRIDAANRPAD